MAQASSDTETVGAQLEGGGGSSESLVARCKSKYFSCAAEREDNVPYKQTGLLKGVQDTVSCTRFCANGHLVMSGLILGVTPISVLVMLIYGVLEIASVHGQYPDSGGLIAVTWLAIIVDWFQIIVDFLSALASTIVICQLVGPARKNQRNPRRVGGRVHAILTGVASVCAVFSFALNIVSWVLQEMWNQLTSGSRLRWFPIPFEILDMIYNTIFLTFILGHFRYARRAAQYNDTLDPAAHLATKDGEVQIAGGVVAGAVTAVVPARPGGDVHLGDGAAAGVADVDAADYCVAHAAAAVRTEEEHTVNCVAQAAAAVRTDPVDNAAPGEPEYRVADDGVPYTKAAFIEHYGGTDEWDAASEYKPDERGGEDVELGAAVEAAASHAGLPPPTMAVGVAAPTPSDAEAVEQRLNPMRADDDGFIVGSVVWEKKGSYMQMQLIICILALAHCAPCAYLNQCAIACCLKHCLVLSSVSTACLSPLNCRSLTKFDLPTFFRSLLLLPPVGPQSTVAKLTSCGWDAEAVERLLARHAATSSTTNSS